MREWKKQNSRPHDKFVAFAGYCEGVKFLSSTIIKLLSNDGLNPEEKIKGVIKFCNDLEKIDEGKECDDKYV